MDKQGEFVGMVLVEMMQQGVVGTVTDKFSGIVANVGDAQPFQPGFQGEAAGEGMVFPGGLSFQVEAIARFGHTATHHNVGLDGGEVGDRAAGRLLKIDGEQTNGFAGGNDTRLEHQQ